MRFLYKFGYRVIVYAVVAVVIELAVYEIYISTGGGHSIWFFILENLNFFLFMRIYTWENWKIYGVLGMFLFVTIAGELIYRIARACMDKAEPIEARVRMDKDEEAEREMIALIKAGLILLMLGGLSFVALMYAFLQYGVIDMSNPPLTGWHAVVARALFNLGSLWFVFLIIGAFLIVAGLIKRCFLRR